MPVKIAFKPVPREEATNLTFNKVKHDARKTHHSIGANLPIVAVDSEGYNGEDGKHRLDLVAAAGTNWTDHVANENQLAPEEIFEFLLSLPEKYGKAIYFIYSGSYDATMWLKQLPDWAIRKWRKKGIFRWKHYLIKWVPRREFILYDKLSLKTKIITRGKKAGTYRIWYERSIHIYDVFGFFQMSFVKALEDWKITDQETIDRIASMKGQRGKFSEIEKAKILEYCLEECQLLVELGNAFRNACIAGDIKPHHWYGAGALASTLMRQYGVKTHISEPKDDRSNQVIKRAYFGGRTEISYQGRLIHGGWQYDINSAYPTAMLALLPCLACGKWTYQSSSKEYGKHDYELWYVKWNCHGKLWGPFPWREQDGRIFYPDSAEGFYHKVEIEAAIALYPDCDFELMHGLTYDVGCTHKPFHFIAERAAYRLALKAEGNPANKPLKLGLNSLYGKTAQTIGKNPPYQSFFWAGLTTATTRAKLLDAIRYCSGTIYSVATDGLISSVEIDELKTGFNLGEWEKTKIIEGILIRPGVYKWLDNLGKYHYGTRGFQRDELLWETIEEHWDKGLVDVPIKYGTTRFIGITQALARGENWRNYLGEWVAQERSLSFVPTFGTRWWDLPNANRTTPFPNFSGGFIRLKLECNCNGNSFVGASAMYRRLDQTETEEGQRLLTDEDQP
ncbi:MAG TPA: DNA polymerase [Streptosporangiaceae bacterium]